ncbi:MAG TPA: MFS transporter, partial [Candidatus Dojkabacteria bacterium]|nr:MFS transporter [Candidatus Dojkabacteria bacterium]
MLKKYTKGFNKVVLFLTMADVFAWGPFFIISALSGIYLSNKLGTGSIEFVGIGTAIYFLTRAITQLPIGYITDKIKKDKDEIIILIAGIILMGFPYILYPLISTPMHYYILQFVFGLGVSLNIANWRKLFAMNIDSGREGRQYSFYETIVSLSTVILSVAVGLIANMGDMYFDLVMIASGILMMAGSIWVVLIFKFP